jgi:hypothetical protein
MEFNAQQFEASLKAQGIVPILIAAMVKQAVKTVERANRPPKEIKKKGKWFPGMAVASDKIEVDIAVTSTCSSCSHVACTMVRTVIKKNSPLTQKVSVSLCRHCPDFYRGFTHEELVSLVLIKEHHGMKLENMPNRLQIRMAKKMRPEDVITYTDVVTK